jgi:CheY-like chemotaxis protein
MPGISGWQVAKAVKGDAPHVPVFVVTGFGVEVTQAEREAYGVEAVFPKPVQIEDLLSAVARVSRARS